MNRNATLYSESPFHKNQSLWGSRKGIQTWMHGTDLSTCHCHNQGPGDSAAQTQSQRGEKQWRRKYEQPVSQQWVLRRSFRSLHTQTYTHCSAIKSTGSQHFFFFKQSKGSVCRKAIFSNWKRWFHVCRRAPSQVNFSAAAEIQHPWKIMTFSLLLSLFFSNRGEKKKLFLSKYEFFK